MSLHDQENVPTKQPAQEAQAWLSRPDEDPRGAGNTEGAPGKGPHEAVGLKPRCTVRGMGSIQSLPTSRDFRRVIARGRGVRGSVVSGHAALNPDRGGPPRLGLSVRVAGGAVARNRVRRRLRAAFRAARPRRGIDVVIRAGDEATRVRFQQLVRDVEGIVAGAEEIA